MKDRKRNRLKNRDYSLDGMYFVTSCVKGRKNVFGAIIDYEMNLNQFGGIIETQLLWLEKQYPYVTIDQFVVMPNHIHLIIFVHKYYVNSVYQSVGTGRLSVDRQATCPYRK